MDTFQNIAYNNAPYPYTSFTAPFPYSPTPIARKEKRSFGKETYQSIANAARDPTSDMNTDGQQWLNLTNVKILRYGHH